MSLTFIGLLIAAIAGISLLHSLRLALMVFCVSTLLGAAAAIFVAGSNIPPGHLALGFLLLAIIIRRGGLAGSLQSVKAPQPGFFLLLFTIWAAMSGFVMPRMFFGQVGVFPLSTGGIGLLHEISLHPRSSNINQIIYAVGNLCAFMGVSALARTPDLLRSCAIVLIVTGAAQIALALIDFVTFTAGLSHLLDFVRNAKYDQLFGATVMGIKRMTGVFPEASSFATATATLFAVMFRLWRGSVLPFWTGWTSLGLLGCLIFAFASTGYVALGLYLMVVYSVNLAGVDSSLGRNPNAVARRAVVISFGPAAALMGALAVAFRPDLLDPITQLFDDSVLNKLSSDSGVERMSWNIRTLMNFVETGGLGTGLGSSRASSFIVALLGTLGVVGTVLFGLFYAGLFAPIRPEHQGGPDNMSVQIISAARSGCFMQLISATISGSTTDLGLMFYVLAGIACAGSYQKARGRLMPQFRAPVDPHQQQAGY